MLADQLLRPVVALLSMWIVDAILTPLVCFLHTANNSTDNSRSVAERDPTPNSPPQQQQQKMLLVMLLSCIA